MDKAERKEILAERDFWTELGTPYGWKLSGWSGKFSALFIDSNGRSVEVSEPIRDALAARAKQAGG